MSSRGFTLLEVLVAMSIFAIIGLGANQMLQVIIESHERTRQSSDELVGMMRGLNRLERDFIQMVPRPVRDEYGERLAPLTVSTGRYPVEFTRTGWGNPAGRKRSELQRVAYDMVDGELLRHFWFVLDRAQDSEPVTQVLFRNVDDFRVNVLNARGEQTDTWPVPGSEALLPAAVEIIVTKRAEGELRRVLPLPANAIIDQSRPGDEEGAQADEDLSVEQVEENDRPDE